MAEASEAASEGERPAAAPAPAASPTKTTRHVRNENIKVAVRVRNRADNLFLGNHLSCVSMQPGADGVVQMTHPVDSSKSQAFGFDHAFWSCDRREGADFATQEAVYKAIGEPLLDSAMRDHFNATLFAYGQTGSGKTCDAHTHTHVAPRASPCRAFVRHASRPPRGLHPSHLWLLLPLATR